MAITDKDLAGFGPAARKQIAAQLGKDAAKQAARKYRNQPTERIMPNGKIRVFDSKKEAERYDELAEMLRLGMIRNLKIQPEFTITEAFITADGEAVRAQRYRADFSYEEFSTGIIGREGGGSWLPVIEDVKGRRTQVYINKMKALADRGIIIREL